MKKTNLFLLSFIVILFAFVSFDHNLVGHWVSYGAGNSKAFLDFNKDGTFKVTANGQTENEGKYKFYNDTFSMYDNNCGMNVCGKYKITFYNKDSASFAVIEDSCKDRAEEVNGGIIKRVDSK
jgi:hypothetical protein